MVLYYNIIYGINYFLEVFFLLILLRSVLLYYLYIGLIYYIIIPSSLLFLCVTVQNPDSTLLKISIGTRKVFISFPKLALFYHQMAGITYMFFHSFYHDSACFTDATLEEGDPTLSQEEDLDDSQTNNVVPAASESTAEPEPEAAAVKAEDPAVEPEVMAVDADTPAAAEDSTAPVTVRPPALHTLIHCTTSNFGLYLLDQLTHHVCGDAN